VLRVYHDTFYYRLKGVIRFAFLRLFYCKRFKTNGLSIIGSHCDFIIRKSGQLVFGSKVVLSNNVQIFTSGKLVLGKNITINQYSSIIAHKSISIGDNVAIAKFVTILDHDHRYQYQENKLSFQGYECKSVRIGNNVWLGDKCTILKGVHIGDNVIVGAHTLVNKDVPSNTIVGGTPFRIIKEL